MSELDKDASPPQEEQPKLKSWGWMKAYTRFVYKFPWVIIALCLVYVGTMSYLMLGPMGIRFVSNVEDYRWNGGKILERWDSFSAATVENYVSDKQKNLTTVDLPPLSAMQSRGSIMYERSGKNILELGPIQDIWRLEDKLMKDTEWPKYCFKPSPAYGLPVDPDNGCAIFISFTSALKARIAMEGLPLIPESLNQGMIDQVVNASLEARVQFVGKDWKSISTGTPFLRTIILLGGPQDGFKNFADRAKEQEDKQTDFGLEFLKPVDTFRDQAPNGTRSYDLILNVLTEKITELVTKQVYWLIGSFGFLFLYSILHTKSVLVSIMGVVGVFFSIPAAITFIYGVVGIEHFDSCNIVGLFLICGIGADSIFIFFNEIELTHYLKHSESVTPEDRLSFAVQKGAIAVISSCGVAAISFLALFHSGIRILHYFGVFCFFLVLFDVFFCVTWFTAFLAIFMKHFESDKVKESESMSTNESEEEVTTYPHMGLFDMFKVKPTFGVRASGMDPRGFNTMQRFFHDKWSPIIFHYRFAIAIFFLILTGVMAIFAFTMDSKPGLNPLPESNPLQHVYTLSKDAFATTQTGFESFFLWGLNEAPITEFKDSLEPHNFGKASYTPINFRKPEVQQYLYDVCQRVKNSSNPVINKNTADGIVCPIEMLKDLVETKIPGCPFPVPEPLYDTVMPLFRLKLSMDLANEQSGKDHDVIGFDYVTNELKYIGIKIVMTTPAVQNADSLRAKMDSMEQLFQSTTQGRPADLANGYHTSSRWIMMETEKLTIEELPIEVAIAIAVASLGVLLFTFDIVYCLLYVVALTATVIIVTGILALIGWELGVIEALMITIAAGFSSDFMIYTVMEMSRAKKLSPYGKIQRAVTKFIHPVSSAFVTTVGAAIFLFPSEIAFFTPFAEFLIINGIMGLLQGFLIVPAVATLLASFKKQKEVSQDNDSDIIEV